MPAPDLRGLDDRRGHQWGAAQPVLHQPPPPGGRPRPHQAHLLPPPLGGGEAGQETLQGGRPALSGHGGLHSTGKRDSLVEYRVQSTGYLLGYNFVMWCVCTEATGWLELGYYFMSDVCYPSEYRGEQMNYYSAFVSNKKLLS